MATLLFQNRYSKIKLAIGPQTKTIDVFIKKKFYNPGPKRDLRPVFEELAKGITPDRLSDLTHSNNDEANILRAYTERRGVIAALKLEREKHKREAFDVSYEFQGYDVKAEPKLIEVKAFRDSYIQTHTTNTKRIPNPKQRRKLLNIHSRRGMGQHTKNQHHKRTKKNILYKTKQRHHRNKSNTSRIL